MAKIVQNSFKINITNLIVISVQINIAYRYKPNHIYQFTEDWRCFNISTKKELTLVSPNNNRCLGFNLEGKFVSLTKIKENCEKVKVHKVRTTTEDIYQIICDRFKVTKEDILSKSRKNNLDIARQILAMLLYEYVTPSANSVSLAMNRKSPASTYSFIEAGFTKLNNDKILNNHYYSIKEILEK